MHCRRRSCWRQGRTRSTHSISTSTPSAHFPTRSFSSAASRCSTVCTPSHPISVFFLFTGFPVLCSELQQARGASAVAVAADQPCRPRWFATRAFNTFLAAAASHLLFCSFPQQAQDAPGPFCADRAQRVGQFATHPALLSPLALSPALRAHVLRPQFRTTFWRPSRSGLSARSVCV